MKDKIYKNLGTLALGLAVIANLCKVAIARDMLLPAGTILQCVLNEPNFSSSTAEAGDPVVCHLRQVAEFGEQAFPRGSYLVGHLESTKEPGHFFGKGNLKLEFDRLGLPFGDLPLNTKIIAVRGYKVDREGKIDGKGHAKRDVAEWMLPPLWPWKVIMLPARGPRPKLKGETALSLRLMDDVQIPEVAQAIGQQSGMLRRQSYSYPTPDLNRPTVHDSPGRSPQKQQCAQTFGPEWHFFGKPPCESLPDSQPDIRKPEISPVSPTNQGEAHGALLLASVSSQWETIGSKIPSGVPLFFMKNGTFLVVGGYTYEKGRIQYTLVGGGNGAISSDEIDWTATLKFNAGRGLRIALSGSHPG